MLEAIIYQAACSSIAAAGFSQSAPIARRPMIMSPWYIAFTSPPVVWTLGPIPSTTASSITLIDQTAVSGEVTGVIVVLTIHTCNVTSHEGQVVGTTDADTSDLIETFAGVQVTLGVTVVTVQDVRVDLRNQSVVLTRGDSTAVRPEEGTFFSSKIEAASKKLSTMA